MAAPESLNIVRTRIGKRIAEIETRSQLSRAVDIGARMAAIRCFAADHGLAVRLH